MSAPKLTLWFPGRVKPVRMGRYQRKYDSVYAQTIPDYWDGRNWFFCDKDGTRHGVDGLPSLPWRGLAKEPK